MTQKILAILLIVVGALMIAYQGIQYTTKDRVADIGPIHVETEKKKTIPLPPIVGGVTMACGIVLLATGRHE